MQEGKTIGQLMEEMRQKAGAQNYHGHTGSYTLITPQGKLYFAELRDSILMVI